MTKIALSELRPNPFRNLGRLPTKPEKVDALKESIRETTFWDNIVCRKSPNGSGGYEIAYGHNRLEALRQLKWSVVDIPVRELDNNAMAKIMVRENHEEWGAFTEVDTETVRSVVEAFGSGKLKLPIVKKSVNHMPVRFAPGFDSHHVSTIEFQNAIEKAYTAQTLADFLGWTVDKVKTVLGILAFQAEPSLSQGISLDGLTSTQAIKVVSETRRVNREAEDEKLARKIGKQIASEFKHINTGRTHQKDTTGGTITTDTVAARTNELMRENRVNKVIARRKAKLAKLNLEKETRQVAIFLDACKVWERAVVAATEAVSKFSPEAAAFTVRKINSVNKAEQLLKGRLKK